MKLNSMRNELLITLLIEQDGVEVMKAAGKLNSNIRRASKGGMIKPKLSSDKLNRALLKKILKLASPAELEILATQFLSQKGFKVTRGIKQKL